MRVTKHLKRAIRHALEEMIVVNEVGSALPEPERAYRCELWSEGMIAPLVSYKNDLGAGKEHAYLCRIFVLGQLTERLIAKIEAQP